MGALINLEKRVLGLSVGALRDLHRLRTRGAATKVLPFWLTPMVTRADIEGRASRAALEQYVG